MFEARPENRLSWDIPTRAINLPSYHDMTPQELNRVADVIDCVLRHSPWKG